jgi:hypothetical protein
MPATEHAVRRGDHSYVSATAPGGGPLVRQQAELNWNVTGKFWFPDSAATIASAGLSPAALDSLRPARASWLAQRRRRCRRADGRGTGCWRRASLTVVAELPAGWSSRPTPRCRLGMRYDNRHWI